MDTEERQQEFDADIEDADAPMKLGPLSKGKGKAVARFEEPVAGPSGTRDDGDMPMEDVLPRPVVGQAGAEFGAWHKLFPYAF